MCPQIQFEYVSIDRACIIQEGDKGFICGTAGKGSYSGKLSVYNTVGYRPHRAHNFQVGRYSALGNDIQLLIDVNHHHGAVYQGRIEEFASQDSENIQERMGMWTAGMHRRGQIMIGSDCCIGNRATIFGGVTIGNGAVVGADAVVTKDVPPYAIVGGNPARVLSYRFSPEIIEGLQQIAWWNWEEKELKAAKEDMQGSVEAFVAKYLPRVKGLPRKSGKYLTKQMPGTPTILFFLDAEDNFPIYEYVLGHFLYSFPKGEAELVLAYDPGNEKQKGLMKMLKKEIREKFIQICPIAEKDEEKLISEVDYLITTRVIQNMWRVERAGFYGVKCISGVDEPVFKDELILEIRSLKSETE